MASSPITLCQINGENVETVAVFIFLGSRISANNDCSHKIKGSSLEEKLQQTQKSYNKPRQHVEKQRHHFADKVCIGKEMFVPVVLYGCESCTIKKAEHGRIDAFKLWYWRRLLRVLWTARRSNQSTLEEINPEYSLEGLLLKLQSLAT